MNENEKRRAHIKARADRIAALRALVGASKMGDMLCVGDQYIWLDAHETIALLDALDNVCEQRLKILGDD